ncbi:MAG: recombination regulator RecX [Betaproteobacteria bacterium]|nr:MAG: recombination regulator RecX [Betaproteobacteria bacterium]
MGEPESLRAHALRMLARREHSRLEMQNRLLSRGADEAEVQSLLDEFEGKGWLSERRFVDAVVQTRKRRFGTAKVLRELKDKGVSDQGLDEAREVLRAEELETARSVWNKKFGKQPTSLAERAKQSRFLAGRGFSPDVIRKVLDWRDD